MADLTIWQGNEQETNALVSAITSNCKAKTEGYACDASCTAHGLLRDQRAMDGLLFMRRMAKRLEAGEFATKTRSS